MIEACEDAWWRSMEELVPIFEKEGIDLHVEPHPGTGARPSSRRSTSSTVNSSPRSSSTARRTPTISATTPWRCCAKRGRAGARPCREHLQPSGVLRVALCPQPAGDAGAHPPAPRHPAGARCRGATFGTLAEIGFDGIADGLRLRLGGQGRQVRFMRSEMQRYIDTFRSGRQRPSASASSAPAPSAATTPPHQNRS